MDSYYTLLQKVREMPGLYLGEKSLKSLVCFMHGYDFRENVEAWEKWTGLNFFEHFDLATRSSVPDRPSRYYSYLEFNCFVYSYYGEKTTMSGEWYQYNVLHKI